MVNKFLSLSAPKRAVLIIIAAGLVQAAYNALLPIYVDEAYYWVWALRPEWSYYDHPAMTAWIIYPFTLLGDSEFTIRLSTVLCMSVTAWYLFKSSYETAGERAAFTVLFIFIFIPAVQMGYCFITPDSPLMMFWAMGMYYGFMALKYGKTKYFIIAGIACGLMMLSKYTGILFPVSLFIYLLVYRRDVFKDYRLYIALFIAAVLVIPIFYWNYQHDWISLKFQYNHGTSKGLTFAGWDFIGFVLGSLFVIPTPIFGYILIKYLWKRDYRDDKPTLYFVFLTAIPMLFFFYKGIFKKMELNWIIPAFIAGTVLIAAAIIKYNMKKSYKYGLIFSIVLTLILKISPILPVPPSLNIAERLLGYEEAVKIAQAYVKEGDIIYSDHLTTASMLTFYLKGHPPVHINVPSRFSQYTIWDKEDGYDGFDKEILYIGGKDWLKPFQERYKEVITEGIVRVKPFNAKEKILYIYRCIP